MRYFSPSTGGFYSETIHGAREVPEQLSAREKKAGKRPLMVANPDCHIPEDAQPVSEARYAELMRAQAGGKSITARSGKPLAIDPVPNPDEHTAARRRDRNRRLAASDWTQLPDASPVGGPDAWRDYREQLRTVDLAGKDWPTSPAEQDEA